MTTALPDGETTQRIPRDPHDTVEFYRDPTRPLRRRRPTWASRTRRTVRFLKLMFRPIVSRWSDIWPIIIGIVLGVGFAAGMLLVFLIAWLEWS